MKITGKLIGWAIATFVWCLFMGVTAISIGVGAAFPPANLVAKPFVCPNGTMTADQETSNPLPGTTYTTTTWQCVDARTGEATQLDLFPMSLYAGLIYGLLLFVIIAAIWLYTQRFNLFVTRAQPASSYTPAPAARYSNSSSQRVARQPAPADGAAGRLAELKKLRSADLISETEYQEKRAEILKGL